MNNKNTKFRAIGCVWRAARALRAAVADGAVDLAAAQLPREARPQLAFRGSQLVGQAKARFQETMVHAAQLAHHGAPRSAALAAREAGHARDHAGARHR